MWNDCKIIEEDEAGRLHFLRENFEELHSNWSKSITGNVPVATLAFIGSKSSGKSVYTNLLAEFIKQSESLSWTKRITKEPLSGFAFGTSAIQENFVPDNTKSGLYFYPELLLNEHNNAKRLQCILHYNLMSRSDENNVAKNNSIEMLLMLVCKVLIDIVHNNQSVLDELLDKTSAVKYEPVRKNTLCNNMFKLVRNSQPSPSQDQAVDTTTISMDSVGTLENENGIISFTSQQYNAVTSLMKLVTTADISTGSVLHLSNMRTLFLDSIQRVNFVNNHCTSPDRRLLKSASLSETRTRMLPRTKLGARSMTTCVDPDAVKKISESYVSKMYQIATEYPEMSSSDFVTFHIQNQDEALASLQSLSLSVDAEVEEQLKVDIQTEYETLEKQLQCTFMDCIESSHRLLNEYRSNLTEYYTTTEEVDLISYHEHASIQTIQTFMSTVPYNPLDEQYQQLEANIRVGLDNICQELLTCMPPDDNHIKTVNQSDMLVNEAFSKYLEMYENAVRLFKPMNFATKEVSELENGIKQDLLSRMQVELTLKSIKKPVIEDCTLNLEEIMNFNLDEAKTSLAEQKLDKGLCKTAFAKYQDRMDSYFIGSEKRQRDFRELFDNHLQIFTEVLENIKTLDPRFSDSQTKTLLDRLSKVFEAYYKRNLVFKQSHQKQSNLGIYFGNKHYCVFACHKGRMTIVKNSRGGDITPNCIRVRKNKSFVIGENAIPRNKWLYTISELNKYLGLKNGDDDDGDDAFEIVTNRNSCHVKTVDGVAHFDIKDTLYNPTNMATVLLKHIVNESVEYLKQPVKSVVLTVPSYLPEEVKDELLKAATAAELKVSDIIDDASAALIAYLEIWHVQPLERYVLVCTVEGGLCVNAFALNGLEIKKLSCQYKPDLNVSRQIRNEVLKLIKHRILSRKPINITRGNMQHTLENVSEFVMEELPYSNSIVVSIKLEDGENFEITIRKSDLIKFYQNVYREIISVIYATIKAAKIRRIDVNDIILTGESADIFGLEKFINEYFGFSIVRNEINHLYASARGAALRGAFLTC